MSTDESDDNERLMRERRPNAGNQSEMLDLMTKTRVERRQWIAKRHPSITEILRKYPSLQDMEDAVSCAFVELLECILQ